MQLEVVLAFLGLLVAELTYFVEFLSNQNANKGGDNEKNLYQLPCLSLLHLYLLRPGERISLRN